MLSNLDLSLFRAVNTYLACAPLDVLMVLITWIGDYAWLAAVLLPVLWRSGENGRKFALAVVPLVALTDSTSTLLKALFDRPRPFIGITDIQLLLPVDHLSTVGFPSGHATNSFGIAVLVLLVFGRTWGAVAIAGAAVVAFSRVYIGVHYPSDVSAGAVLGSTLALLTNAVINRGWAHTNPRGRWWAAGALLLTSVAVQILRHVLGQA